MSLSQSWTERASYLCDFAEGQAWVHPGLGVFAPELHPTDPLPSYLYLYSNNISLSGVAKVNSGHIGASLVIRWLRCHVPNAVGPSLIPG